MDNCTTLDVVGLLTAFYTQVEPSKVSGVEAVAAKYAGREAELFMFLEQRYKTAGFFKAKRLDVCGKYFDATYAVTQGIADVVLPVPNVRPLDNIAKCRMLLPAHDPHAIAPELVRIPKPADRKPQAAAPPATPEVGFATAGPIRNIIIDQGTGPKVLLRKCMDDKARVRVLLRKINGVRGVVAGFLVAFDKHMNMVLVDAEEYLGAPNLSAIDNVSRIPPPRAMNQILLRGDCVMAVCRDPVTREPKKRLLKLLKG